MNNTMLSIDPTQIPTPELHQHILGAVSPRPIAFVSTISPEGEVNLAPYSFFNAFSSNPPILVFSSNRRVSNNTTKDTLHNIQATSEAVINIVNYDMVRQMAIAGIEYSKEVNEFEKAGLTPIPSDIVRPFRVKESHIQLECKMNEIITLGEKGGAGHLIICEVVRIHIDPNVLDEKGRIDPQKMDSVARMGYLYYARIKGDCIFTIRQPAEVIAMGFDKLPETIKNSKVLTGNDIAQIAGMTALPTQKEAVEFIQKENIDIQNKTEEEMHLLAKDYLQKGLAVEAAKILMAEN